MFWVFFALPASGLPSSQAPPLRALVATAVSRLHGFPPPPPTSIFICAEPCFPSAYQRFCAPHLTICQRGSYHRRWLESLSVYHTLTSVLPSLIPSPLSKRGKIPSCMCASSHDATFTLNVCDPFNQIFCVVFLVAPADCMCITS